jgi:hypothetical protein
MVHYVLVKQSVILLVTFANQNDKVQFDCPIM